MQSLEAEVARLQHLDAVVNSEKNALAHQNNAIRGFLASQSLDLRLDSVSLDSPFPETEELSELGGAAVDIRMDPDLEHERVFLDFPDTVDTTWTSSEETWSEEARAKQSDRHAPVSGDSWAALDFILALEWPCREHIYHHEINPNANVPEACAVGKFHGHALTATAAVYQSSLPTPDNTGHCLSDDIPNQNGLQANTVQKWQLPHSEIDKYV